MSDVRIVVDHLKLDYSGLMNVKGLFKLINAWFRERDFHKKEDKNQEQNLPDGKYIEYEISPWKKITEDEYTKHIVKIRALFKKLKKVEVVKDKKKVKIDQGQLLIYFDGFIEHDVLHRWDQKPFFVFFRTIFDKFINKTHTERFEQKLTQEVHSLYEEIEKFLNTYRHFKVVSKVPHF